MNEERMAAFGRYNFLIKELTNLYVKFSSLRASLNKIIGGYIIDLNYAEMDLQEAKSLILSLIEIQNQIKSVQKESNNLKDTYGFE